MPKFNHYKRKIYSILSVTAIVVTFLLALLLGINLTNKQKANYIQHLSASASALETNASVSMTIITKAMEGISKGDYISHLISADSYQEFLYYSLRLSEHIQKTTTDLAAVDYQIAVTMLNPPTFDGHQMDYFINGLSTNSVDDFLYNQKNLNQEDLNQIYAYFEENTKPLLLPHYEQENLKGFFYCVKQTVQNVPFLYIVAVPAHTLIGDTSFLHFMLYDQDRIIACDTKRDTAFDYDSLYAQILSSDSTARQLSINGSPVILTSLSANDWKVAYVYENLAYRYQDIVIFLLISICIFCTAVVIMKLMTEQIYKPVKEVIIDTIPPEELTDGLDEFELIRRNSSKIHMLNQTLMEATQVNERLISQQSYQELLFSSSVNPEQYASLLPLDSNYCVALFELQEGNSANSPSSIALQKSALYHISIQHNHIYYAGIDGHRCCFIIQCDDSSTAKQILFASLHSVTDVAELDCPEPYAALSNIYHGVYFLHKSYLETLKIQEYRTLFPNANIITYEQIAFLDTVTYSYPLAAENKLIQYTIDGKAEALELFSHLIHENIRDKSLPSDAMQNLVYALLGTISRIFQELKTTPEEFLGESIDFKYFYEHWNDSSTVTMIKSTLEQIIAVVNNKKSSSDEQLLQQMLQYIYDNFWDNIMLNDMADHFNISPKYCGILFKELSEDNFKNFLNHYRIDQAKELIEKNPAIKIQDLSKQVGFNSPNSFLRVFRKYTGLTPTEYIMRMEKNC